MNVIYKYKINIHWYLLCKHKLFLGGYSLRLGPHYQIIDCIILGCTYAFRSFEI